MLNICTVAMEVLLDFKRKMSRFLKAGLDNSDSPLAMDFVFDIRKAIAATAYLCNRDGGAIDLFEVIKMLYLADRQALLGWNRPITGDRFVSMKHGPVVSRIYDLIRFNVFGPEMEKWKEVFGPREGNLVVMKKGHTLNLGPLSPREVKALGDSYLQIKKIPQWQISKTLHEILPEWEDPNGSSKPIDPKTIFEKEHFSQEQISEIEKEMESYFSAKVALQAVN